MPPSSRQLEELGLPPGFAAYSPYPFAGVNQKDSRNSIDDKEWAWIENYIRLGNGKLRTLWDVGAPVYTRATSATIILPFFFNIGATEYVAIFLSDGTAVQVELDNLEVTVISSAPGTFYRLMSPLPACVQSGSQYLIIANNITPNSYWIWDGSLLYSAGGIGPQITLTDSGLGYFSLPMVTPFGGSGSGIVVEPVVVNGSVVALTIIDPGENYTPGDIVQFQFTGGGGDNGAILEAVLTPGVISALELVAGGSGYSAGTLIFTGGGGTGAAGTYEVTAGVVTSLFLTNAGSGYTGSPVIGFSSGGTGAEAVAILSASAVSSVNVIDGGTNFTSTPLINFEGGGGSGATGTVVLTGGVITSVTVTAGGSNYTSSPAIVVEGGANNAASAIAELMPYGVSGTSLETYQSRIWVPFPDEVGAQNNGGTFLVSAPESLTDFATSDGGLIYTSTDRFLRVQYTNIRQSNGYLYPFGDSSVDVISNVQTTGNPATTSFNYQNADPQVGTSWRDSLQDFSRTILFANQQGVYGLYGGAVTKVSGKLDDLFDNAIFPPAVGALLPSSAVMSIHNIRCYILLMTIFDPFLKIQRNVLLIWDEQNWYIASQGLALTYIATQEVNSNLQAWGTDGDSLFPLLSAPSDTLEKILRSKLYGVADLFMTKQALAFYLTGQDKSAGQVGIATTMTIDTENAFYVNGQPPGLPSDGFSPAVFAARTPDISAQTLGWSITSTSPDFILEHMVLGYMNIGALYG